MQSSVITDGLSLAPIPRVEIIDLTGSDESDNEWTDSEDSTGIDTKSQHPCSLSQSHSKPHVPSPLPTVSQLSLGDSETTLPAADAVGLSSSVSLVLNDVTSISTNTLRGNPGISDTTGASRVRFLHPNLTTSVNPFFVLLSPPRAFWALLLLSRCPVV